MAGEKRKSERLRMTHEVIALNAFDVKVNGHSLVRPSSGAKKIWELYQFMLTHRDHVFTPEALIEGLWEEHDYSNPRGTLRRQMQRLREVLGEADTNAEDATILYSNGYYKWNPDVEVYLDADAFEKFVSKGDLYMEDGDEAASLDVYSQALILYCNDYLSGTSSHHWVYPARNHYRRLFLRATSNVIALLNKKEAFEEIIDLCQKAIQVDTYEEAFHINLIAALMGIGERKHAFEHYEYVTGFFERELGIAPSDELKELYKRLLQNQNTVASSEGLQAMLTMDLSSENAFFCEPEVFRSIHELEQRKSERSGEPFGTCVVTVEKIIGEGHQEREKRIERVKRHLLTHLRKGDTITRWNDNQLLLLLPGVDDYTIQKVVQRTLATKSFDKIVEVKSITFLRKPPRHHKKFI